MPAADSERHPQALAVAGLADLAERYGGGYCARHHARQPADPRDRGQERGRHGRGDPGSRPVLARLRRRQHPQRHRHADGRHRSAGTDRHAALRARMAFPHPQRARALRPAAQVQRRLRRRRHHPGAGGYQRHRLPGGRGEGRLRRRARRLVPSRARRHHRPQGFRARTGVVVKPADATKVADAVVRVFIDHGDRTNRNKARLKYVLDAWGFEKFLVAVEEKLGRKLVRVPAEALAPRPAFDRAAHIGVHPQKQAGLNWIGVVLPVGKLTAEQMRGLAGIARELGDGDIRLTVWQNLLISGVPTTSASRPPKPRSRRSGSPPRRPRSAPASSPAPAMSAASSPPPTPSAMPRRSRAGARRASSSTARSTSISPAVIIPARSTTSATSACSAPRCRCRRTATPSRATTSMSAAASARRRARPRTLPRREGRGRARRRSSACCKAYLAHRAAPEETFFAFARRHEIDALKTMFAAEAAA